MRTNYAPFRGFCFGEGKKKIIISVIAKMLFCIKCVKRMMGEE